jgi:hypothetical protein
MLARIICVRWQQRASDSYEVIKRCGGLNNYRQKVWVATDISTDLPTFHYIGF